jgi:uncharacterized membrane protein
LGIGRGFLLNVCRPFVVRSPLAGKNLLKRLNCLPTLARRLSGSDRPEPAVGLVLRPVAGTWTETTMPFSKLVLLYAITTVAFFALDFIWLSTATSRIYKPYLGDLLAPKPNLAVAAAFYLFYIVGLIALAIVPGLKEGAIAGAMWRGALFGLLAYATYDLTNLATVQGWAWQVSVIDMIWGTALNTIVAAVGFAAGRWLNLT